MSVTITCVPGQLNHAVVRGATFQRQLTWKTGEEGEEEPVNLTGYTAKMQVRDPQGDPGDDLVVELSTENGRIALGGAAGTIDLLISATDTAGIDVGSYAHDLMLTSGGGVVTYLVTGSFDVKQRVTV
jgi:hypothetical protein